MTHRLLDCLIAVALGAALSLASPAFAGRGGGGGFGGGAGGFGARGGGMGMGMHGGMGAGAAHFSGMGGGIGAMHFSGTRFSGAPFAAHAAFAPGFSHGAFAPHAFGPRFAFRHGHFFHHRFHRFAFIGAPYYVDYGYDSCWRRLWTAHGPHWVNVCTGYGWY